MMDRLNDEQQKAVNDFGDAVQRDVIPSVLKARDERYYAAIRQAITDPHTPGGVKAAYTVLLEDVAKLHAALAAEREAHRLTQEQLGQAQAGQAVLLIPAEGTLLQQHLAAARAEGKREGLEVAARVADSFPWSRGPRHTNPLFIGRREGEKTATERITKMIREEIDLLAAVPPQPTPEWKKLTPEQVAVVNDFGTHMDEVVIPNVVKTLEERADALQRLAQPPTRTWTSDVPTEPGWYWWRHAPTSRVHMTRVNEHLEVAAMDDRFETSHADHAGECGGQWCPLDSPPQIEEKA